jgi:hypothetical protein
MSTATISKAKAAGRAKSSESTSIGGVSTLKGALLYGAVILFATLFIDFIVKIFETGASGPASLNPTAETVAVALAGVLGTGFALAIGAPTREEATNKALNAHLEETALAPTRQPRPPHITRTQRAMAYAHLALSLDPPTPNRASWPRTIGVWTYLMVASAVAVTYLVNEAQTPDKVKGIAIAFGGYVLAMLRSEYATLGGKGSGE